MPLEFTVIGKYQVIDRLGGGGMGSLYLARDPALDRLVAIKVLRGEVDSDELRERFSREARALSRLEHPNIVTIFDYDQFHDPPFIAMRYVAGQSLAEVIKRRAALSTTRRLQIIEEVCAGMGHAHRASIIHRDLKPANIMIDADSGLIKIVDFGIARSFESSFTQFAQVMGTPSYMSPEQAGGGQIGHRSDVFAIGAVFYELLSYRRAFSGDSESAVLNKIQREDPPPLSDLVPGIDPAIVRIVGKALARDPNDRYENLDLMRLEIAMIRESLGPSPGGAAVGPRSGGSLPSQLEQRRSVQIAKGLEAALSSLERHDYLAAIDFCEQALLLDHNDARVLAVLESARTAVEEADFRGHLRRARELLDAQSLTAAEEALSDALRLRASDPDAMALYRDLKKARHERERLNERTTAAAAALARARAALAEGAVEAALRAAKEAMAHAPDSLEALEVLDLATQAIERHAAEEELARGVAQALDATRHKFKAGDRAGAIADLERFTPVTPAVTAVLNELRRTHDETERNRTSLLSEAERLIGLAEFTEAQERLDAATRLGPATADMARLQELATRGRADESRRAQLREHLAAGGRYLQSLRLEDAEREAAAALSIDSTDENALQLHHRVRQALERATAAAAALARARAALAKGAVEAALQAAKEAMGHAPDSLEALEVLDLATQAIERRADEEELARKVAQALGAARHKFKAGDQAGAIADLERFTPVTPAVTAVLNELRRTHDETERSRTALLSEAERLIGLADFTEAQERLDAATRLGPATADTARLQDLATRGRADEARRAQLREHVATGGRHLESLRLEDAEREAAAALSIDSIDENALQLHHRVRQALERATAAAAALARARAALAEGAVEAALQVAKEAMAHAPNSLEVLEVLDLATQAIERRAAEEELARGVAQALDAARHKFKAGDRAGAIADLERFTPVTPAVTAVLNELRRTHDETERNRTSLLSEAERLIGLAEFTEAQERLDAATRLGPATADMAGLQELATRGRADEARRAQLREHLAAGGRYLESLRLEDAEREAAAALSIDSTDENALQLHHRVRQTLESRQRDAEFEQRARAVIDVASTQFEAGSFAEAIAALEGFTPRHSVVETALVALRSRLERVQQRALNAVAAARLRFEEGNHDGALAELEQFSPATPLITQALIEMRTQVERAREEQRAQETRRLQHAKELQQQLSTRVARARALFADERFDDALQEIDAASVIHALDPGVETLRSEVTRAREAHSRAVEIETRVDSVLAEASSRFENGDRSGALELLSRFSPRHVRVHDLHAALKQQAEILAAPPSPPPQTHTATGAQHQTDRPAARWEPSRRHLLTVTAAAVAVTGIVVYFWLWRTQPPQSSVRQNVATASPQLIPSARLGNPLIDAPAPPQSARPVGLPGSVVSTPAPTSAGPTQPLSEIGVQPPSGGQPEKPASTPPPPTSAAPEISTVPTPTPIAPLPQPPSLPPSQPPPSTATPPTVRAPAQPAIEPPAVPDPVAARARDEQAIHATLRRFKAAYDVLDVDAFAQATGWSGERLDAVRRAWAGYRTYSFDFEPQPIEFSDDSNSATLVAQVTESFSPRVGRPQRVSGLYRFRMTRRSGTWIVESRTPLR